MPTPNSKNSNLFYTVQINGHAAIVLDYWHPSNQFPDLLNYYGLMGELSAGAAPPGKGSKKPMNLRKAAIQVPLPDGL